MKTDMDFADVITLLSNTPNQAESLHVFETKSSHLHFKWQFTKFDIQVHVPQQQCLIYWRWYQYTPS